MRDCKGDGETGLSMRISVRQSDSGGLQWTPFLLICLAYLATTTGEAVLSPVYPLAADDIDLDLTRAGLAFAILATSIAIFNIVGGLLLRRMSTRAVLTLAVLSTAAGALVAASASGPTQFLSAQVLLGAGAGLLYPGAVMSVGTLGGSRRKGFAMAIFGVFFSGGLVLAAGLAALGTTLDWRWSFGIAAVLAGLAALSLQFVRDLPQAQTRGPVFAGLAAVLGVPTAVGVIGGISQYATVSFLPIFAVDIWDTSEAAAAGVLAIGRVFSVPAKLLSGQAADRYGPVAAARGVGVSLALLGLCWTLLPWIWIAALAAILFAAEVSALFPLANLLAFERVGSRGPALGAFRSLQLGAGAVGGVAIGAAAEAIGLRSMVALVSAFPILLILVRPAPDELTSR